MDKFNQPIRGLCALRPGASARWLGAVTLSAFVAACGGGSSASPETAPTPAPIAASPQLSIVSLSATPSSVEVGQMVTLAWQVTGASALSIDQGVGPVTGNAVVVKPPLGASSYELTASGNGASVSQSVAVSARPGAADGADVGIGVGAGAGFTERTFAASATSAAVSDTFGSHVADLPSGAKVNRLFVHLSGSYGKPVNSLLVLHEAAMQGLHAIGLAYPNVPTVDSLCSDSGDAACHEKVRLEIIDGTDRTPLVSIDRGNSIESRLASALNYLQSRFPGEGWGQYLLNGAPKWDSIVISGHSQGGGHAAMMARDRLFARVCMFASPKDYSAFFRAPAAWQNAAHVTPTVRYYGFNHVQDSQTLTLANWRALGLSSLGAPISVDSAAPPYAGSHQLTTNAAPASPGEFHGSVVVDRHTPLRPDGQALFKPVWTQMCFQ